MRGKLTDQVCYYHLISRGRNREEVFQWDEDFWFYLNVLRTESLAMGVKVHAWALMSNHVHLLVEVTEPVVASRLLRTLNSTYAKHFNHLRGRSGAVWGVRPKKLPVVFEDYFINCQLYIEHNPVRSKNADRAECYQWSSAKYHLLGIDDQLTTPSPWYMEMGKTKAERLQTYRRMTFCYASSQLPPQA